MPLLSSRGGASAKGFGFTNAGNVIIDITSNTTNYDLFTAAGSPTSTKTYIVNISAGVTIGATSGNTAFTVGQFPTGTKITINNNGSIQGYGGAAGTSSTGGAGGDAINANYANQTVVINNNAGATIYGGGGGGGKAGTGGTGGTGGQGQYVQNLGTDGNFQSTCAQTCAAKYGAGAYCVGGCGYYKGSYRCDSYCGRNVITSGGAGGAGGAGGNGGAGQGYSQSNTNGSVGSAGTAGSNGGTNAGKGGTGGTGGTGGNGGTWGNAGTSGATGSTGATGANGNYSNGLAGSSGASGSAGGSAGRYLVKGSNSVTLNNSGTVAGGLA